METVYVGCVELIASMFAYVVFTFCCSRLLARKKILTSLIT